MHTIYSMMKLMYMNSEEDLRTKGNDCWGMPYFQNMFSSDIESYIDQLTAKVKPLAVVVCCIYFPDEAKTGSWADMPLGLLGYNSNPSKLQTAIRSIFNSAYQNIHVEGTQILPFPMFSVLDGKTSSYYTHLLSPSSLLF